MLLFSQIDCCLCEFVCPGVVVKWFRLKVLRQVLFPNVIIMINDTVWTELSLTLLHDLFASQQSIYVMTPEITSLLYLIERNFVYDSQQ